VRHRVGDLPQYKSWFLSASTQFVDLLLAMAAASGSKRRAASVDSHLSAKSGDGVKRTKHVCDSCDKTVKKTDHVIVLKDFVMCTSCNEFVMAVQMPLEEYLSKRKKAPKAFEALQDQRKEYELNKGDISKRDFQPEEVFVDSIYTSELEEPPCTFLSRDKFKAMRGFYPEDVGMNVIKVLNKNGEEQAGVCIAIDLIAEPTLTQKTLRVVVHRRHELRPELHFYKDQGGALASRLANASSQFFGQSNGGRYAPKMKAAKCYTAAEVDRLAAQYTRNKARVVDGSAVAQMVNMGELLDPSGDAASESGSDHVVENTDQDELGRVSPSSSVHGGCERSPLSVAHAPIPLSPTPKASAQSDHAAMGPPSASRRKWASLTLPRVLGGVAPEQAVGLLRSSSHASLATSDASSVLDGESTQMRTKLPEHWIHNVLTVDAAFKTKGLDPFKRQVEWAESCVKRVGAVDASKVCRAVGSIFPIVE
jgi:hypothetical protein